VGNSDLNVRLVINVRGGCASRRLVQNGTCTPEGNHFLSGNAESTEGLLGIARNSDVQLLQYSCSVYAGKWLKEAQVRATSCVAERVQSRSHMIVKTQKAVELSSVRLEISGIQRKVIVVRRGENSVLPTSPNEYRRRHNSSGSLELVRIPQAYNLMTAGAVGTTVNIGHSV
jgi:hypothetical protein